MNKFIYEKGISKKKKEKKGNNFWKSINLLCNVSPTIAMSLIIQWINKNITCLKYMTFYCSLPLPYSVIKVVEVGERH